MLFFTILNGDITFEKRVTMKAYNITLIFAVHLPIHLSGLSVEGLGQLLGTFTFTQVVNEESIKKVEGETIFDAAERLARKDRMFERRARKAIPALSRITKWTAAVMSIHSQLAP